MTAWGGAGVECGARVEPGQPLYGAGYKNGEGVCLAVG